ncbi:MAG: serine/threonine protein kinase [Candidatus Obscuribacterales bacterium]|nr:serine/threonine protein kinase [Candidatus Obscuribacterales bacterium]
MTDLRQDEFPIIQSDRYKIISVLGSGGAGIVYKALDTLLDKTVAIKKLHRTASRAESLRFQREAKMAATLNHPNVSTILDFGLTEKHEPYMVLDYIDGQSLSTYLYKVESLQIGEALGIFIQIAEGLAHAHRKRVIHRDVTPNNVMLVESGGVKSARIVDFGLAKSTKEEQDLTMSGVGIGTPLYMSPEQIRGKNVDQRSDIYSFGCLMYTALKGEPPFESDNILSLMDMHLKTEAPRIKVISLNKAQASQVEALIDRCLKKKPPERYQSVDEILVDLNRAANAKVEEDFSPRPMYKKDNRGILLIVVLSLAGAGSAFLLYFFVDFIVESSSEQHIVEKVVEKEKADDGTLDEVADNTGSPENKARKGAYKSAKRFVSSDSDLVQFAKLHPEAIELELGSAHHVTSEGLAALEKLPLDKLSLKHCASLTAVGFKHIVGLKNLRHLKLIKIGKMETEGFAELKKCKSLEELAFIDCNIIADQFEILSTLPGLTRFELKDCTGLKEVDVGKLSNFKNLDTLTLSDVGDTRIFGFDKLKDLPIKTIDLSGSPIAPVELKNIAAIRALRELTICYPPRAITPLMFAEFKKSRPNVILKNKFVDDRFSL